MYRVLAHRQLGRFPARINNFCRLKTTGCFKIYHPSRSQPRLVSSFGETWVPIAAAALTAAYMTWQVYPFSEDRETRYADRETMLKVIPSFSALFTKNFRELALSLGPSAKKQSLQMKMGWTFMVIQRCRHRIAQRGLLPLSLLNRPRMYLSSHEYAPSTRSQWVCVRFLRQILIKPIVPFAGGSSVEGNFTTPFSGISIDFSQMNEIVEFHEDEYDILDVNSADDESMDIVVQPGVNWVDMNDSIKHSGLWLPMDPSPTVYNALLIFSLTFAGTGRRHGSDKLQVLSTISYPPNADDAVEQMQSATAR